VNAFAAALATLVADPNLGVDALWQRGDDPPLALRVLGAACGGRGQRRTRGGDLSARVAARDWRGLTPMRLTATRIGPSLTTLLERERAAGARAARATVTTEGRRAQEALRAQVRTAFGAKGARLANTWRLTVYAPFALSETLSIQPSPSISPGHDPAHSNRYAKEGC